MNVDTSHRVAFLASDLDALVVSLQTAGRPQLPAGGRCRIEQAAAFLIVNREALDDYAVRLYERLPLETMLERPAFEEHDVVLDAGLAGLEEESLAALLLNPAAMYDLAETLAEAPWQYAPWRELCRRETAAFREEHQIRVPTVDELVAGAADWQAAHSR